MRPNPVSLIVFSSFRREASFAICLTLCLLALGSSAGAQHKPPSDPKDASRHHMVIPPHGPVSPAESLRRSAASPQASTTPKEIVLHHFVSPPHGAYPSSGVIRDFAGNLYGTTDGAYSDIGGGGTNNAGVVFKLDPWGRQTVLYSFTGGADGSAPNVLARDSAGNLYGATNAGGSSGAGVIYKLTPSGKQTVLHSFTGGADGANPDGLILDWRGNLYGAALAGGASSAGVIFKIDASENFSVLYTFTGGNDGATPNPTLALDFSGNLYGTANNGGASGAGLVFKLDPSGHQTVLYTFTGGNDGANPNGVTRDSQGNFYGTTTNGGVSGAGVVFKLDPSGNLTALYSFTGGNDGGFPNAGVSRDLAGNLYGTTNGGGTAALGVAFKVDPSGHETVLHTFTRGLDGDQPDASGLVLDLAGNLYGTNAFGGAGGIGAVFKLDPSGNETVLYAFPDVDGGQYTYNTGLIFGSDGLLYGATNYGGRNGHGVLYRLDGKNDETVLYTFDLLTSAGFGQPSSGVVQDSQGNLYGTTFLGQTDVGYGFGVVYKVDGAGHTTVLHNFTNATDGGNPYGGLILDSKGNLYGTTNGGGAYGAGVVFKIDTSGNETVLYTFTGGSDGGFPLCALLRDSSGNLYGTANGGGSSGAGVVFKIDTSGNETVLYSFTGGADGAFPIAGVIRDSAGNFYGTTNGGGASGAGVVYRVDTLGNETVVYSFTGGDDGGFPLWVTLIRDAVGDLYGTTAGGGTAGAGVVFEVTPAGVETVLHSFTGGADGSTPFAGVVFGPDGNLYGVTPFGGQSNAGLVFELKR